MRPKEFWHEIVANQYKIPDDEDLLTFKNEYEGMTSKIEEALLEIKAFIEKDIGELQDMIEWDSQKRMK